MLLKKFDSLKVFVFNGILLDLLKDIDFPFHSQILIIFLNFLDIFHTSFNVPGPTSKTFSVLRKAHSDFYFKFLESIYIMSYQLSLCKQTIIRLYN